MTDLKKWVIIKTDMANSIPNRSEVPETDKWDLSTLYKSDQDWEKDLSQIPELTKKFVSYKGHLKDSSESLLNCLKASLGVNSTPYV